MDQKAKVIIVVFILLLGAASFLGYQAYVGKQVAEKERDTLKSDNATLQQKAQDAAGELQQLQTRMAGMTQEIDRNSAEKAKIQERLDLAAKEKSSLIEQIKILQAKKVEILTAPQAAPAPVAVRAPEPQAPQGDESYWADMVKTKTDLEFKLQNLVQELKTTKAANEQLQREKSSLALEESNYIRERTDSKRSLEYNQKISDSIAAELVREKNDKYRIEESVKDLKTENANLRLQLRELNARKNDLAKRYADLSAKNDNLSKKVEDMEFQLAKKLGDMESLLAQKNTELAKLYQDLSVKPAAVELPPIVVRPNVPSAPAPVPVANTIVGKVLTINRDNNFVVIDLGANNGIKVGTAFSIYRSIDDKSIAEVEVIQVRKSISACDIKKEYAAIHVGDVVK